MLIYAGLDGWRRQMALHGRDLVGGALELAAEVRSAIEDIDGLHVHGHGDFCGPGRADDFDPLPVVMDVSALGLSGYQAADWLREHHGVDAHLADHRRISAQITHGDDQETTGQLVAAFKDLAGAAVDLPGGPQVDVPAPADLRTQQARLPRDAFFGPAEHVPIAEAAGRVAAEMITPYPPGIPAVLPGERLTEPVLRYLSTGRQAGMNLPDASAPDLDTIRVVAPAAD